MKYSVDLQRRRFLAEAGVGLGSLSLLELVGGGALAQTAGQTDATGILGAGHHPAPANRVIMLHMLGAISHVDTFDYKPRLVEMHG